jgi:hypothetical protein
VIAVPASLAALPDARLYRKADGRESRLCFMGQVLMENRNGLAVDAVLTHATGTVEREAALAMLERRKRSGRITVGADKAYDVTAFVEDLRQRKVTPHITINGTVSKHGVVRTTAVDGRTRHAGYAISQILRKRIEDAKNLPPDHASVTPSWGGPPGTKGITSTLNVIFR